MRGARDDDHCRLEGAELVSVYVKLAGFLSVEYVKVVGKDPKTGLPVEERLHGR